MGRDTLSDVLRTVRLRGAVFSYVHASPPWVVETPHARVIIPAIMPGAEHMIGFHAVAEGSCWGALVDEPPARLSKGDVILFPQGDPHVMSSAPGMRPARADSVIRALRRAGAPPELLVPGVTDGARSRPARRVTFRAALRPDPDRPGCQP